ncbi:MAG: LysR family transcriptional regulator [Sporolactobacillus sp.]
MEFRQIEYFIEVAKREHITQAAEALHIAQSAVSRQITLLESELGVPLFTRRGRNIQLTSMGKIFLEHAKRAMMEFDKATQKIDDYLNPNKGLIRLGISTSLSVQVLPTLIEEFHARHPGIRVLLHQGSVPYLKKLISQGAIDLAFASPLPKTDQQICSRSLFKERMVLLMQTDHHISNKSPVSFRDLRHEHFITFRNNLFLQELFINACRAAGFQPNIVFEGEDMDSIKGLVAADFGIALMPEHAVAYNLPEKLITVPLRDPQICRIVGIIQPSDRDLAPSEKLFFRFVDKFFQHRQQLLPQQD